MNTSLFEPSALPAMRQLMSLIQTPSAIDMEEQIQLASIQADTQLWYHERTLAAFAYVDNYNNLWFEAHPNHESEGLWQEIIDWGVLCMKKRNAQSGHQDTVDASCLISNTKRLALFERHGFEPLSMRTLNYVRSLSEPIIDVDIPGGFRLTHVAGEHQVEQLVSLHRSAYGTKNMSVEGRLAMMRAPYYELELDLLLLSPDGEFVACCTCEVESEEIGWTDPVVVHANYQKRGLGKALLTAGIKTLRERGVAQAGLSTSNQNRAMMQLATTVGFHLASEKLWFAKAIYSL